MLILLAVLLGVAPLASAKLDGPRWLEAEQRFRALFASPGSPDPKAEVIRLVASDGEARAWTLLTDGLVISCGHLVRISDSLSSDLSALQVLLGKRKKYPAEEEEMYRLQGTVSQWERQRADEEKTIRALVVAFSAADEGGRRVAIAKTRGHKDFAVRMAGARVAAIAPEEPAAKTMIAECAKDADARVRLAVLDGLQKAPGSSWHDVVVARVEDPDWGVQLVAARIAGDREIGKAIPALIKALATCSPRVGEQVVASLTKLTGQTIEPYAEAWAKWWEANRSKWGEDGRPLQPLNASNRPVSETTFYGLKVRSDKVLFIIDTSLSMKHEKKAPEPEKAPPRGAVTGEPEKPKPEPEAKFSGPKIEIAKQELRRALRKLPKEAMFNIISFNHGVAQWQPKMVPATEKMKEEAYAWIRDMTPAGSTYIDGALRLAFKMAGMGAYDRAYETVGVDTIVLLSDGAPTDNLWPESKDMDPNEILGHVREWNSQKRVVIHCVGIDVVVQGIEFLKKLAAENGGTYVDG